MRLNDVQPTGTDERVVVQQHDDFPGRSLDTTVHTAGESQVRIVPNHPNPVDSEQEMFKMFPIGFRRVVVDTDDFDVRIVVRGKERSN